MKLEIGNIVGSYKQVYNNTDFDLKFLSNEDYIINEKPNLIIGYDNILKLNPNQDILEKKYKNGIYWTFNTKEKIDDFYRDIDWFIANIFNIYQEIYQFKIVDPVFYNLYDEHSITNFISKLSIDRIIILNKKIFIKSSNIIYSLSIDNFSFFKINSNVLLDIIENYHKPNFIKKSDYDNHKKLFKDSILFERFYICFITH